MSEIDQLKEMNIKKLEAMIKEYPECFSSKTRKILAKEIEDLKAMSNYIKYVLEMNKNE